MAEHYTPGTQAGRFAYALWHDQRVTEWKARQKDSTNPEHIANCDEHIAYHRAEASRLRNYKEPQ